MTVRTTDKAKRMLKKLPTKIQDKAEKAFEHLANDPFHPALNSRRMSGTPYFEARIDYHYRFIYSVVEDVISVVAIGQHDEGLGKK
jgi:mRNA-degrading endonuclease RelE of RelBE toxin-antitoxin system